VDVFLLPSEDGTTLPDPPGTGAALTPVQYWVGSFLPNASAPLVRSVLRGIVLPPLKFCIAIQNNLGTAFPASSCTLQGRMYGEQAA
jgi:hypothetical protein